MADNAIGMIETKGYVAALAAADAMVKAANVTIVGRDQVGDGLVAVTIIGIPIALLGFAALAIWIVYRVARGWLALKDRRPMYV